MNMRLVALRGGPISGAWLGLYQLPHCVRKCHTIDQRGVYLGALTAI